MSPLVTHVAVSVIPKPVPVVVKAIASEIMQGRRSTPKIVVHTCRNRLRGCMTDGVSPLVAKPAGHVDVTDQSFVELLDSLRRVQKQQVGRQRRGVHDAHGLAHSFQQRRHPQFRANRIGVGPHVAGEHEALVLGDDRAKRFPMDGHAVGFVFGVRPVFNRLLRSGRVGAGRHGL